MIFTAIIVSACTEGPTNPLDALEGSYFGTHAFTFDVVESEDFGLTCPGSLSIFDVDGESFFGNLEIERCPPVFGALYVMRVSGTFGVDDAITLTSAALNGFIEDIGEDLACPVTRADPVFTGTLADARLQARVTATLTCQDRPSREFEWLIQMESG